jgi:ribose-phosphate pyrophosphokinase
VRDQTVILVEDMVCGGTTLARVAASCIEAGARKVVAAAAHGAFTPEASRGIAAAPIDRVFVLDHIPPFALDPAIVESKLVVLDGAKLVAHSIRHQHGKESVPNP